MIERSVHGSNTDYHYCYCSNLFNITCICYLRHIERYLITWLKVSKHISQCWHQLKMNMRWCWHSSVMKYNDFFHFRYTFTIVVILYSKFYMWVNLLLCSVKFPVCSLLHCSMTPLQHIMTVTFAIVKQALPKVIWEERVTDTQLCNKSPLVTMGHPKFTPKTAPSTLTMTTPI